MKYAIIIHHGFNDLMELPIQDPTPVVSIPVNEDLIPKEVIPDPPIEKRLQFSIPIEIPSTRTSSPSSNITFTEIYPEFDDKNL